MSKPILCIDFDGVIHSYENGWQGGVIYGTATPGFFDWALKAQDLFTLTIYSSRSKTDEGVEAMKQALGRWWDEWVAQRTSRNGVPVFLCTFAHEKPPAFLTIDDRAIQFRGNWASLDPVMLRAYEVWNKPFDKDAWEREQPDRQRRSNAEDIARCAYAERRVPWWLRLLGVPRGAYMGHWSKRDRSLRTSWGEISFGAKLIALTLDRKNLHIAVPGVQAFIRIPHRFRLKNAGDSMDGARRQPDGSWYHDSREYGFSFRWGQDWGGSTGHGSLAWNHRRASFSMPWGWNRQRGDYQPEYMDVAGEWHSQDIQPRDYYTDEHNAELGPLPWSEEYTFHYMTRGGEAQHVRTTVERERRTDTYRVFGRVTRRRVQDLIAIKFHEEVGNQRGSWKGGVTGTGCAMKPGETPGETLRRFQLEQAGGKFDR
jgi:hypothetical protein